ncbi:MAG: hypothetical protein AAF902_06855 [Chloroflexota bacterium]
MNPFTRFLRQWSNDDSKELETFIEHWDALEAMAIRVYKAKQPSAADFAHYQIIKGYMDANYSKFTSKLEGFWKQSEVGGQLDHADPFAYLFQYDSANGFVDNWAALQHLPAAREALNGLLVELGNG